MRSWMAAALALAACNSAASDLKQGRAVHKLEYPVQVAPLVKQQLRYLVVAPGSIEAFQQVQITARVAGVVDKVAFVEGQGVKEGQVLVNIQIERYQVAVDQAKAAVAKAEAGQAQAEAQLSRRKGADEQHPGLIPGEEISTFGTSVATAKADVEAARQALRVAELNLRDSFVRAPIAGAIQTRTVQAGQYVQPGVVLATLLQRDPLLLRFQVTEQDAPRLKAGAIATLRLKESPRTYAASIKLVAEAADPQTRLVPVTAEVDDKEHRYWLRPGAYCEVSVPVGAPREAIVIPTMSVQPTESGNLVYVVEGNVARERKISLGMHTPEGGVEVTRGLEAGELLVVRGFEPLSDRAPVKVAERITLEVALGAVDGGAPAPKAVAP